MEREETSDQEAEDTGQHVSSDDEISQFVIYAFPRKHGSEHRVRGRDYQNAGRRSVKEHIQEVFVVVEADAVGNPRAVMVHLENTLVALGAVMASVWLCSKASLAHPDATKLLTFEREFVRHLLRFLGWLNERCLVWFFSLFVQGSSV